jgi:uncharacterized protein (TIGR02145 family)
VLEKHKIKNMKKITSIISTLFLAVVANAQSTYLINFTGTGATTNIDSIRVENLTSGAKVKLSGGDILRLNVTTGIDENSAASQLELTNFPNPFNGQTKISYYSEENTNILLSVTNVAGQVVAQLDAKVEIGKNNFNFLAPAAGVYFINVVNSSLNFSKKIVCNASSNATASLDFTGTEAGKIAEYQQTKQMVQQLRSAQATTVDMAYQTGSIIRFTGYSHAVTGMLTTIISDIPTNSKTLSFMFIVCMDADSNHYPVVKIGAQYWMAENLRTTRYSNRDTIIHAGDTTSWKETYEGAYCTFNDSLGIRAKNGRLYNWYAVSDPRDLSPAGWHVATIDDQDALTFTLDQDGFYSTGKGGLALKSTKSWDTKNGIDYYGFNGLATGERWIDGSFDERGMMGLFWLNSENDDQSSPLFFELYDGSDDFWQGVITPYIAGYAVRCVKNP